MSFFLLTLVEIVPSWFLSNMSKAALKAASSSGLSLSAMMLFVVFGLLSVKKGFLFQNQYPEIEEVRNKNIFFIKLNLTFHFPVS